MVLIKSSMTRERFEWVLGGINYKKLTNEEAEFVESCKSGWEKFGKLTPAMEKWLEGIYREKSR